MRTKMILFYAVLIYFCNFGYSCSTAKTSTASDPQQENRQNEGMLWKLKRCDTTEMTSAQQIKYGGGHGGDAGGSVGGGHAGGGGSSSEGNGGVIPVYAAGGAKIHHNNYNGGISIRSYPLFTAIIWEVLAVVITNAFPV